MSTRASRPASEWLERKMEDPKFRAAAEELEPSYQVARLRMLRGWTQKELAKRVGTKQSSIARLESGKIQPRLSFLRRVVEALDGDIEVLIRSSEEAVAERAAKLAQDVSRLTGAPVPYRVARKPFEREQFQQLVDEVLSEQARLVIKMEADSWFPEVVMRRDSREVANEPA